MRSTTAPMLCLAALCACAHSQTPPATDAHAKPSLDVRTPAAAPPNTAPAAEGQSDLDKALEQLRGLSTFFRFDDATLSPEAEQKLASVGTLLAKFPALKVEVAGNADERGTESYNLALGQRRADAAKSYLLHMGARAEQIGTISFGAEKPRAAGHDEEAWKQNRRDDVTPQK